MGVSRWGGTLAGMMRISSKASAVWAPVPTSRCPQWIGSNVPPRTPARLFTRPRSVRGDRLTAHVDFGCGLNGVNGGARLRAGPDQLLPHGFEQWRDALAGGS